MAPNSRGGPPSWARHDGEQQDKGDGENREGDAGAADPVNGTGPVVSRAEVEARGSGVNDPHDSFHRLGFPHNELRVLFTGTEAGARACGVRVICPVVTHTLQHTHALSCVDTYTPTLTSTHTSTHTHTHPPIRTMYHCPPPRGTGIMFLTRLPVPKSIDHHPAYLMRAMAWFPLIGALVGAWCGGCSRSTALAFATCEASAAIEGTWCAIPPLTASQHPPVSHASTHALPSHPRDTTRARGAVWFDAAAALWSVPVASAVSWLSTVWLTGCFHEGTYYPPHPDTWILPSTCLPSAV